MHQQHQADHAGDAQLSFCEQFLSQGHHRQGWEAPSQLAGGDLAVYRAGGALQQVQARRAMGQSPQQGTAQGDTHELQLSHPSTSSVASFPRIVNDHSSSSLRERPDQVNDRADVRGGIFGLPPSSAYIQDLQAWMSAL